MDSTFLRGTVFPHVNPRTTKANFPGGNSRIRKIKHASRTSFAEVCCSGGSAGESSNNPETMDSETFSGLPFFLKINEGRWKGKYRQFSFSGEEVHSVNVEVLSSIKGKGEDSNLNRTLRILQAPPKTRITGEEPTGHTWMEVKLEATNRFTVNRNQQLALFEESGAFALSHQTAEVIQKVLQIGVLGEDEDGGEPPKGFKFPSSRPALVTEKCLYSKSKDERIRAFQVLDPRGVIDTVGFFHEFQSKTGSEHETEQREFGVEELLGEWRGIGTVQRSPLYGGSVVQQETTVVYSLEEDGTLSQKFTVNIQGTERSMTSKATVNGRVLRFKGLQTLLLPGGVALSCPSVVTRGQAFAFECCWMTSPTERQRLQRTYDTDGMVVSNTLYVESKVA